MKTQRKKFIKKNAEWEFAGIFADGASITEFDTRMWGSMSNTSRWIRIKT
jgi:hypothetical protein